MSVQFDQLCEEGCCDREDCNMPGCDLPSSLVVFVPEPDKEDDMRVVCTMHTALEVETELFGVKA